MVFRQFRALHLHLLIGLKSILQEDEVGGQFRAALKIRSMSTSERRDLSLTDRAIRFTHSVGKVLIEACRIASDRVGHISVTPDLNNVLVLRVVL